MVLRTIGNLPAFSALLIARYLGRLDRTLFDEHRCAAYGSGGVPVYDWLYGHDIDWKLDDYKGKYSEAEYEAIIEHLASRVSRIMIGATYKRDI